MHSHNWPICEEAAECPICREKPLHHPDGILYHWCEKVLAYCDEQQWEDFVKKGFQRNTTGKLPKPPGEGG